jgi:hypothetical protein
MYSLGMLTYSNSLGAFFFVSANVAQAHAAMEEGARAGASPSVDDASVSSLCPMLLKLKAFFFATFPVPAAFEAAGEGLAGGLYLMPYMHTL